MRPERLLEAWRRRILDVLADGERSVTALVEELGLTQPQVSKHLRVLRDVGAVSVRDDGRHRLYRLNAEALKPIHEWVGRYERSGLAWFARTDSSCTRVWAVLEALQKSNRS